MSEQVSEQVSEQLRGRPRGRALRVVVCGTGFGRTYLRALDRLGPDFELAGVLARGGAASRAVAAGYGVPYYTSVPELPDDVDVACVVVRAGVAGGLGGELAQALLTRGIHVLQEQPVHHDELAACLRAASRHQVRYQLNSFYVHVEPVRRFLLAARALRQARSIHFVDAACGLQVLYPLVDILGRSLGGLRPWALGDPAPPVPARGGVSPPPYTSLTGAVAGVPLTLRVQNQMHPTDPDNHAYLLHRVTLGTDAGVLTLADTHGPVLWSPRLHVEGAPARTTAGTAGTDAWELPSTAVLGPVDAPTFRQVLEELWPQAVGRALRRLRAAILAGPTEAPDPYLGGQYQLATCRLWLELTERLGRPTLIDPPTPVPLSAADLEPGGEPRAESAKETA